MKKEKGGGGEGVGKSTSPTTESGLLVVAELNQ